VLLNIQGFGFKKQDP